MTTHPGVKRVLLATTGFLAIMSSLPARASEDPVPQLKGSIVYTRAQGVVGGFTGGPQNLWVDIPSVSDLDVFTRAAEGGEEHSIAASSFMEEAPRWSQDGRWLGYSSNESGSTQLFVIAADGKKARQITSGHRQYAVPSWSPDGRWMVAMGCDEKGCRLYRMRPNGSGLRAITKGPYDYYPDWSPDGEWIVFTRQDRQEQYEAFHLYLVRPDGSYIKRISTGKLEGFSPRWSPDGKQIAFQADSGLDAMGFQSTHIYVMDREGSNLRQVTTGDHLDDFYPCWSPDGSRIAFARAQMIYRPDDPLGLYSYIYGSSDLFAVTLDGGEIQRLTDTPTFSEAECDWT